MFTVGVFGIILDEQDRVLFCHRRDHDLWNLPGGGVESGESPWDALVREVKEEVGLDIKPVHLSGVYSKSDRNQIVFSFVCEVVGGELGLSDEADKIEYFKFEDIPKNTSPKQVERIKHYFENKGKTHYMVQTGPSSISLVQEGKL